MSIADSVRSLSEKAKAEIQRNTGLPNGIFLTTIPPMSRNEEWMKRRFIESRRTARQQDELEDLSWFISDLGGNW